jgi:hypothetical protein
MLPEALSSTILVPPFKFRMKSAKGCHIALGHLQSPTSIQTIGSSARTNVNVKNAQENRGIKSKSAFSRRVFRSIRSSQGSWFGGLVAAVKLEPWRRRVQPLHFRSGTCDHGAEKRP